MVRPSGSVFAPRCPGVTKRYFMIWKSRVFWSDYRRRRPFPSLREALLERAIGVIYMPQTERLSHYFHARLSEQFDAVLHFDVTRAVEPLDRTSGWEAGEIPETFPSGI